MYVRPKGEPVSVTDNDKLGLDIGDKDVSEAARILRLLHIKVRILASDWSKVVTLPDY